VLAVAWFAARASLGYGSEGTGSYTDPFGQPLAFAAQAVERAPILVHSLLGALPADLWEVFFVRRGLTWLMVLLGLAFIALLAMGFVPLLRADRGARFWAIGGGLALLVVCGAHPNDRHLLLVGIALFVIHAVIAPLLLPIRARIPGSVSRGVDRIDALLPGDPALARQDLVLVSVPFKYLCNFASVVRRANGGVSPRRWRCLGVTPDDVHVSRPDERTLVLRPTNGYLRHFEDTNVRARSVPFAAGDRVELPDFTIVVRAVTSDARPLEVELRFAVPLEDPSLRWLVWRDRAYRPFAPPAVGHALTIPAERFAFGDLLADR
jgi:hypothetical protein